MNRCFIAVIVLLAGSLQTPVFAQVFAQELKQPPLISVSGSAEIKVAPDEIYLRVGVESHHEKLDEAKRQNDESISKALAFLKSNQVEDKNVQTDFISIEPDYNYRGTKAVVYIVRRSIEIKLTKVAGFDGILTGLLNNGITNVHGIEFRTTQFRKHRDAARALAIRAAREKAEALTAELGVKTGKVYSISANDGGGWWGGSSSYWGSRGGGMAMNNIQNVSSGGSSAEADGDGTLSIGQISVSATVNVSFLIE